MKVTEQQITDIIKEVKWSTENVKSLGGQSIGFTPKIVIAELEDLGLKVELTTRSVHKSRMIIISMLKDFIEQYYY